MSRSFLLVHGMCCTGQVWSNFRAFYEARGIRVFTPTLRPEQRVRRKPPAELGRLRLADYVDDLEQEVARIEQQTGQRPTVIGHSMGGLLAQILAERSRVNAAVFISPTPPKGVRDAELRLFWGGFVMARALGLVPRALPPNRRITERLVLNRVPREEREAALRGMVHESREVFADFRVRHIDEAKISVPVLTVVAGRDKLVSPRSTRLTAAKYAAVGGTMKEYANHGHWLYAEPGWEQPAADILQWVEEVTP